MQMRAPRSLTGRILAACTLITAIGGAAVYAMPVANAITDKLERDDAAFQWAGTYQLTRLYDLELYWRRQVDQATNASDRRRALERLREIQAEIARVERMLGLNGG